VTGEPLQMKLICVRPVDYPWSANVFVKGCHEIRSHLEVPGGCNLRSSNDSTKILERAIIVVEVSFNWLTEQNASVKSCEAA